MADNVVSIIFELLKKGSGGGDAKKELVEVDKASKDASASVDKLAKSFEKIVAAVALEEVLRRSVDRFLEAEQATSKLEGALRSTGQFTKEYADELDELAHALSQVSTFQDDQIKNLEAVLIAFGARRDNIKLLTTSVLDLATVLGKDLPAATGVMTAALNGEFGPAQRTLRIQFDETKNAAQNFEVMMRRVAEISGGQAAAAVKTLGGEYGAAKKEFDSALESLGKFVVMGSVVMIRTLEGLRNAARDAMHSLPGANKSQTEESVKALEAWRAKLEELVQLQLVSGKLSDEQAANLQRSMRVGTAGLAGRKTASGELEMAYNSLFGVSEVVEPSFKQKVSGGGSGAAPPTGRNPEQERLALIELNKLREQFRSEGLEGLDKERAEILQRDKEQSESIIKNANLARISDEEKIQRVGELNDATLKSLALVAQKRAEMDYNAEVEAVKAAHERAQTEIDLQNEVTAAQLKGQDLEVFQETANHEKRLADLRELAFENQDDYQKLIDLENQLHAIREQGIVRAHSASELFKADLIELGKQGEQAFAQGLAGAIVDAFDEGGKAFQKFASNFLKQIAQMILQTLILRAIQSAFAFGGGGQVAAAGGGQFFAAAGGFEGMTSGATYLDKFKVLAGESGMEHLTVLARPRVTNFAGLSAHVGDVGNRRMAVVNADALANKLGGGGAAGQIALSITLSPELEARITQNSIAGATLSVAQALTQDTPISRAAKRISS